MEGYLHPLYAESFSEIGEPLYLPRSKGWLIKRQIPGTPYFDAMGPYPLFFCEQWGNLLEDFAALKDEVVSVSFVIGPFATFDLVNYQGNLDIFKVYKDHYILDLSLPFEDTISKHHRQDARRALQKIVVETEVSPNIHVDEWCELYGNLIERHHIIGIRKFSRESFAKQLKIPNTFYFKAVLEGKIVGGIIFILVGDVAYAHLSAFTREGYDLGAPKALRLVAFQYLSNLVSWIDNGGGTNNKHGNLSGLDRFKSGWSNTKAKSYFCGKILDKNLYDDLTKSRNQKDEQWFPAYRFGDY